MTPAIHYRLAGSLEVHATHVVVRTPDGMECVDLRIGELTAYEGRAALLDLARDRIGPCDRLGPGHVSWSSVTYDVRVPMTVGAGCSAGRPDLAVSPRNHDTKGVRLEAAPSIESAVQAHLGAA